MGFINHLITGGPHIVVYPEIVLVNNMGMAISDSISEDNQGYVMVYNYQNMTLYGNII
jgi:hypothetical protein